MILEKSRIRAGFNRNILGCKVCIEYCCFCLYYDLIETYWDVKISQLVASVISASDLIETYWDVKKGELSQQSGQFFDLIETYWDVKYFV